MRVVHYLENHQFIYNNPGFVGGKIGLIFELQDYLSENRGKSHFCYINILMENCALLEQ